MWTLVQTKEVSMDYVKYYELIVDDSNKMRVNELCSLKEEAESKGDQDKVAEINSELNTLTNGGIYDTSK
jgi:hypothetical protein|tara:strand:- start:94 stop:303 length:210 start_codon:yes stop_codon:yes gene_type:complete